MVTIGPRVYYAMAKNGAFFASAANVHEQYRTPVIAIIAQGICASVMTLTPFPQLFFYIGMTLNFTAVLAVASIFVFRRRRPGLAETRVVSFAYPLVPLTFVSHGLLDDDLWTSLCRRAYRCSRSARSCRRSRLSLPDREAGPEIR